MIMDEVVPESRGLVIRLHGHHPLELRHLVVDFTGTLALDGRLLPGVVERLRRLAEQLQITVITADTFGTATQALEGQPITIRLISTGAEKAQFVRELESSAVVAIGNGRNDIPMFELAAIAIAVVGPEGAAAGLVAKADVVVRDILEGLDLLSSPLRLIATLRD